MEKTGHPARTRGLKTGGLKMQGKKRLILPPSILSGPLSLPSPQVPLHNMKNRDIIINKSTNRLTDKEHAIWQIPLGEFPAMTIQLIRQTLPPVPQM